MTGRAGGSSELQAHLDKLWSFLLESLDTNRDKQIDPTEWHTAWQRLRETAGSYDDFPSWYQQYCEFFFKMLDEDSDGAVTEQEYGKFLALFNRKPVAGTFQQFQGSGKSTIGQEEFKKLIYGMTCIEDQKYEQFWGTPTGVLSAS